jgi:hypothetical protein
MASHGRRRNASTTPDISVGMTAVGWPNFL